MEGEGEGVGVRGPRTPPSPSWRGQSQRGHAAIVMTNSNPQTRQGERFMV